jgi:hypothetical protein
VSSRAAAVSTRRAPVRCLSMFSCYPPLVTFTALCSRIRRLIPTPPDPTTQPHRPGLHFDGFGGEDHISPTQILDEAAVEIADDDYWDVQSDEEMVDAEDDAHNHTVLAGASLNVIRRIHLENSNELGIRRYDAFLYDGFLTGYRPEYTASPLRNPKTARLFAHFVHVVSKP